MPCSTRSAGATPHLETIVRGVIAQVVGRQQAAPPLLRTVLLVNDRDVERRVAHLMEHGSERLAALLRSHLGGVSADVREQRRVDFAVRAVFAVLQQQLLFPTTDPGRFRFTDKELTRRLGDLFLALVRPT